MHFKKMTCLPKYIQGVRVLGGVEANIMDYNGSLDMPVYILEKLDWVIASMHESHLPSTTTQNHSQAWIEIAKNPHVDLIGHCGDDRFRFDYEKVIKVFKEYNKILEVNNHSFIAREGSKKNCVELSKLCMKYEVPILLTSDAHFCLSVGDVSESIEMLEEINFPNKLILNTDYDVLISEIKRLRGRDFSL
ncbi:putative phosphatase YcdX [bioreactor metagenome]|uniref:Putative phosphatase YcdX n=1 Tax=bioreactor metagenome TaxID=1076179 RepID=A0A645D8H7_9ZZZZ